VAVVVGGRLAGVPVMDANPSEVDLLRTSRRVHTKRGKMSANLRRDMVRLAAGSGGAVEVVQL